MIMIIHTHCAIFSWQRLWLIRILPLISLDAIKSFVFNHILNNSTRFVCAIRVSWRISHIASDWVSWSTAIEVLQVGSALDKLIVALWALCAMCVLYAYSQPPLLPRAHRNLCQVHWRVPCLESSQVTSVCLVQSTLIRARAKLAYACEFASFLCVREWRRRRRGRNRKPHHECNAQKY